MLLLLLLPSALALPRLSTEMHHFWEDSGWLYSNATVERYGTFIILPGRYQSYLDGLGIERQVPVSGISIRDALGEEEKAGEFASAAAQAGRAREKYEGALGHYQKAKGLHDSAYTALLKNFGIMVASLFSSQVMAYNALTGPERIDEFYNYSQGYYREWSATLTGYFDAYSLYSDSANRAYGGLEGDYAQLLESGLLSDEYHGGARQAAMEFRSRLLEIPPGANGLLAQEARDENRRIRDYLLTRPYEPDLRGEYFWLVAGRNGTIMRSAMLHSQFLSMMSAAAEEVRNASSSSETAISLAQREIETANGMRSDLVMPHASLYFGEGEAEASPFPLGAAPKLSEAKATLRAAGRACAGAKKEYAQRAQGYISKTLLQYSECISLARHAESLASAAAKEAIEAEGIASSAADFGIGAVRSAIREAQYSEDPAALQAIARAKSRLGDAESLYEQAMLLPTEGERYALFIKALKAAREAGSFVQPQYLQSASQRSDERVWIGRLSQAISRAKSDGLETFAASEDLAVLKQLSSEGALTSLLAERVFQTHMDSFLSFASMEYADLPPLLLSLRETAGYYEALVPGLQSAIGEYSSMFLGGQATPASLGNLAKAREGLQSLLSRVGGATPEMLGLELSKNARAYGDAGAGAYVGEGSLRTLIIETLNPTPISTNSSVEFSLPVPFEASKGDILQGGEWVSGMQTENGVARVQVGGVAPNTRYGIRIERHVVALPIEDSKTEMLSATLDAAIVRQTISFRSSGTHQQALLSVGAPQGSSPLFAALDGIPQEAAANSTGITALLGPIGPGAHSAEITYSVPSPFSVRREAMAAVLEQSHIRVSYQLVVFGSKLPIPSAEISLMETGAAGASDLRAVSLGAHKAAVGSAAPAGGDLLYVLEAGPIMPGEEHKTLISYKISSLGDMDGQMLQAALQSGRAQDMEAYQRAHSLHENGKFDSAYVEFAKLSHSLLQEEKQEREREGALAAISILSGKELERAMKLVEAGRFEEARMLASDAAYSGKLGSMQAREELSGARQGYAASGFSDPEFEKLSALGAGEGELSAALSRLLSKKTSEIGAAIAKAEEALESSYSLSQQYSSEYLALGRQARNHLPAPPSQLREEISAMKKEASSLRKSLSKNATLSLELQSQSLLLRGAQQLASMNQSLATLSDAAFSSVSLASAALESAAGKQGADDGAMRSARETLQAARDDLEKGRYADAITGSRKVLSAISALRVESSPIQTMIVLGLSTALLAALAWWALSRQKGDGEKRKLPKA